MLRDRAAQFMTHLQKLSEDEVCVDLSNLISFFAFVFHLPYYYHTYSIVTVSILWVILCICLVFRTDYSASDWFFHLRFGGEYSLIRDGDDDGILPNLQRGLL